MKILVIHHSGDIGGGTLSCFDIIKALKEKRGLNCEVVLALPPGNNDARNQANELGIKITSNELNAITFNYYNGGSSLIRILLKYLFLKRYTQKWKVFLEKEKPDLVLLNSSVQWPMINILNALNIKCLCFNRETLRGKRKSIINKIIASKMEQASGVSFISSFDKKLWGLLPDLPQTVIPDMVDKDLLMEELPRNEYRKKLNLKKDKFYVLYVGGMVEFKGAKVIIEAMNYITNKQIELLFLGDLGNHLKELNLIGKIRNRRNISFIRNLNQYILEHSLTKRIHLIGKKENITDWYAVSDVVVFPAVKAHQARPIYEAGAFRKPIIVSDFPNYKEYLADGVNGFVFKPEDARELAKSIELLSADANLYEKIRNNNYKTIKARHSSEKVNKQIIYFIEQIIRRP